MMIDAKEKYEKYFTAEDKVSAFNKIAEKCYYGNFGMTSKADLETLLFSIYLEQILKQENVDENQYSDYTLSKLFGITQARVSSLKVKKELIYPSENFDWKNRFKHIAEKARYDKEDGKIKLFVRDQNVFIELKNLIEEMGGYVEIQLTKGLLQMRLEYFLDVMVHLSDEKDRDELCKKLKETIKKENKDIELEKESFGEVLKDQMPEFIIGIIGDCIPVFGGTIKEVAQNLYRAMK